MFHIHIVVFFCFVCFGISFTKRVKASTCTSIVKPRSDWGIVCKALARIYPYFFFCLCNTNRQLTLHVCFDVSQITNDAVHALDRVLMQRCCVENVPASLDSHVQGSGMVQALEGWGLGRLWCIFNRICNLSWFTINSMLLWGLSFSLLYWIQHVPSHVISQPDAKWS